MTYIAVQCLSLIFWLKAKKNTLYINRDKLTDETDRYLKSQNIRIDDYSNIAEGLRKYGEYNILLDPNETSYSLYKSVSCPEIVRGLFSSLFDEND